MSGNENDARRDRREMASRGRIGALTQEARHDTKETTWKARETFLGRFERDVDPDGTLAPEERAPRAQVSQRVKQSGHHTLPLHLYSSTTPCGPPDGPRGRG